LNALLSSSSSPCTVLVYCKCLFERRRS
jgi:hypothetical protein